MKTSQTVLRAITVGLLIVSFVASGQTASLAFGLCFVTGAILAACKGIHAISKEELTVIPDELGFRQEAISRTKEPTRFWFFVFLLFTLAVLAATYGIYVVGNVLSKQ